jgi:hypothetical protein
MNEPYFPAAADVLGITKRCHSFLLSFYLWPTTAACLVVFVKRWTLHHYGLGIFVTVPSFSNWLITIFPRTYFHSFSRGEREGEREREREGRERAIGYIVSE